MMGPAYQIDLPSPGFEMPPHRNNDYSDTIREKSSHEATIRAGRAICEHDWEVPEVGLFSPIMLRGMTFRNRIAMSPMCMVRRTTALPMIFTWCISGVGPGGVGLVVAEATAVSADGALRPTTWSGKTSTSNSGAHREVLDRERLRASDPPTPGAKRVAMCRGKEGEFEDGRRRRMAGCRPKSDTLHRGTLSRYHSMKRYRAFHPAWEAAAQRALTAGFSDRDPCRSRLFASRASLADQQSLSDQYGIWQLHALCCESSDCARSCPSGCRYLCESATDWVEGVGTSSNLSSYVSGLGAWRGPD